MQIRLINTSMAYYVDGGLRTANDGDVVTDIPDVDAQRLIDAGCAVLVEPEPTPPVVKRLPKRGA